MREAITWSDHDPADAQRYGKVLDETDVWQPHFVRTLAEMAGLTGYRSEDTGAGTGMPHAWRESASRH